MFRKHNYAHWLLAVAFVLPLGDPLHAGEQRCVCQHCGCQRACHKVCRLVYDEKKVAVVCWGSQCEDFCLPGKSCRGCLNCEEVCTPDEEARGEEACSASKTFVWYDWTPGGAKGIHTKKKLMKKTIEKKIPSYQWVVEDLCPECEAKTVATVIDAGVIVPLPPETTARLKYEVQQASGQRKFAQPQEASKPLHSPTNSLWPAWLFKPPGMDSQ